MSADQLASDGVGPNEPRVRRILQECARATSDTAAAVVSEAAIRADGGHDPKFVVDGLVLGATVYPDSPAYKAYTCRPSDQFPGFTWCAIKHPMTAKSGPYNA